MRKEQEEQRCRGLYTWTGFSLKEKEEKTTPWKYSYSNMVSWFPALRAQGRTDVNNAAWWPLTLTPSWDTRTPSCHCTAVMSSKQRPWGLWRNKASLLQPTPLFIYSNSIVFPRVPHQTRVQPQPLNVGSSNSDSVFNFFSGHPNTVITLEMASRIIINEWSSHSQWKSLLCIILRSWTQILLLL